MWACCWVCLDDVVGVMHLHDVVYIICRHSSAVRRFSTITHQRLSDIVVKGLREPWDIAGCDVTSQIYIADNWDCIWRVSSDGEDADHWLPNLPSDKISPWSLSLTSSRLLVTSLFPRQLIQFDAEVGDKLRCIPLPDYMFPYHAVESPTGTFIVSHLNTQLNEDQISQVSTEGQVLRQFSGSVDWAQHVAVDSYGNIFVADSGNSRVLLLDAQLALRRVIVDEHQLNHNKPRRLFYTEQSGQLLVVLDYSVAVFDVLCR